MLLVLDTGGDKETMLLPIFTLFSAFTAGSTVTYPHRCEEAELRVSSITAQVIAKLQNRLEKRLGP